MGKFTHSVIARELNKMVRERILTEEVAQQACKKSEGFIWDFAQERLQRRLDEVRNKPRVESSTRVSFEILRLAHGNYIKVGEIRKDGKRQDRDGPCLPGVQWLKFQERKYFIRL
jgi:hypothetical protein